LSLAGKIAILALNDNHSLTPIRYMYLQFYSFLPDEEDDEFSTDKYGFSPNNGKANARVF
jgi:hypothetical protein